MGLIANLDLMLGVNSSAFNTKVKESSKLLQEKFGLDKASANSLATLEKKLKQQAETFGMNSTQIQLYKLKLAGVPPEALKAAAATQKHIDKLKAQQAAALSFSDVGPAVGTAFAAIGAAAIGGAVALGVLTKSQLDQIDKAGDLAGRLGLPVDELTRLQYAFKLTGSEAEDVGPALNKLNVNLSDAARKGGPAADALKRLGLDAKAMVNQSPSANVLAIADAFGQVANPADRAGIAMDLFGKGGVNVLNSLAAGGNKLRELSAEADQLGITVSAADAEMAGAANDAVDRIWGAFGGLGKKIASGLAPYIIDVGAKFLEWVKAADTTSMINAALDLTASTLGFVADAANMLKATWFGVSAGITLAIAGTIGDLGKMAHGIEALINVIPGLHVSFASALDVMASDLNKLAGEQWNKAKSALASPPSTGIHEWFDGVKSKASAAASAMDGSTAATKRLDLASADLAEALKKQAEENAKAIELFGKNDAEKKVFDLQKQGATEAQLAPLRAQAAQLQNLEEQKKAMDELKGKAKSYLDASLTPLQKFKKEREEITKAFGAGLLDEQQKNQAIQKAFQDTVGKGEVKHSGALDFDSKEARSVILANMNGNNAGDWQKQLTKIGSDQLVETKRQTTILENNRRPKETVVSIN